jgi:hypothetical protein
MIETLISFQSQGFPKAITEFVNKVRNLWIFRRTQVGVRHLVKHLIEVQIHIVNRCVLCPQIDRR